MLNIHGDTINEGLMKYFLNLGTTYSLVRRHLTLMTRTTIFTSRLDVFDLGVIIIIIHLFTKDIKSRT